MKIKLRESSLGLAMAVSLMATTAYDVRADFADGVTAYDAGNYKEAFDEWLPLAQNNDTAAMRNVGHIYRRGLGIEQDYKKALNWYKRAATLGFDQAQANVGDMYLKGEGVPQDYEQAVQWFASAAQQGHVLSQYILGFLLENGLGVEKNEELALGWYKAAAQVGYAPAIEKATALKLAGVVAKNDVRAKQSEPPVEEQTQATAVEPEESLKVAPAAAAASAVVATEVIRSSDEPGSGLSKSIESAPEPVQKQGSYERAKQSEPPVEEQTQATAVEPEESLKVAPVAAVASAVVATEVIRSSDEPGSGLSKSIESAPEPVQKQGSYDALKSPVKEKPAAVVATAATVPVVAVHQEEDNLPAATTSKENPEMKVAAVAVVSATVAVTQQSPAQEKVTEVAKPTSKSVSALVPAPVKVAAVAAVPAVATVATVSAKAAGQKGLTLAEKLEMADLAYTLKEYQQSLSIWAVLAQQNNAEAQYRLGKLFYKGQAVPIDRVRAYYWWEKAKGNGAADASVALANLEKTLTHIERRQIQRTN